MVEIEPLTGIGIPIMGIIVALAIPLVLWSMGRFNRTSEGTLTGSIEIKGLKNNVEEVREYMDKGFDKMESVMNKKDEETKATLQRLWDAVNQNQSKLSLQEYRIKQLERMQQHRSAREEDDNNNG
jgi:hypothetical protein